MSANASNPDLRPTKCGPFLLVVLRRGDLDEGCGVVEDAAGRRSFARWAPKGSVGAQRLRSELQILALVPDNSVPRPLALLPCEALDIGLQELRSGQTLRSTHGLSLDDFERVASTLVRVLSRAHRLGLVHCDVSPDNVIVDRDGNATLADWELATPIDTAAAPGTLGYTPPEAWSGAGLARPERDLYALAVSLWEKLEGRCAFSGTRDEILRSQSQFEFATSCAPPPLLALLFAAARERSPLPHSAYDLSREVDFARVTASAIRAELNASMDSMKPCELIQVRAPSPTPSAPPRANLCTMLALAPHAYPVQLADLGIQTAVHEPQRGFKGAALLRSLLSACDDTARIVVMVDAAVTSFHSIAESVLRIAALSGSQRVGVVRTVASETVDPTEEVAVRLREYAVGPVSVPSDTAEPGILWGSFNQGSAESHPELDRETANVTAMLQQCELAVHSGQPTVAYRLLVRLCTNRSLSALPDNELLRLAYCWSEVGVPDAVLLLESLVRTESTGARIACFVLRSLASAARIVELRSAVDKYAGRNLGLDLARHRAVVLIHAREPRRALDTLRSHSAREAASSAEAGVLFLITRASALRLTQRPWSARRHLRIAESSARALGHRRLELLAQSNNLVLSYDIGHRDQVAGHWEAHAEACESWGLRSEASVALIRVAAHWIEVGQAARGLRHLDRAERLFAGGVRSRWAAQCGVYRTWALDRLEDWRELPPPSRKRASADEASLYYELLRWELHGSMPHLGTRREARGATPPGVRAAKAALREFTARGVTKRGMRILRSVHRLFDEASPIPSCLLRFVFATVAHAREAWVHDGGRPTATRLDGDNAQEHAAAAMSVVAGHVPSPTLARHLLEFFESRGDERWPGIRRWEWALAATVVRARAVDGHNLAMGLAAAESHLTRLGSLVLPTAPSQVVLRGAAVIEVFRATLLGQRAAQLSGTSCADQRLPFIDRVVGRDMDIVLQECGREAIRLTGAERAVVIFDLGDGRGRAHIAGLTLATDNDQLQVCQSVLARADESGSAVLLDDAISDPALCTRPSVKRYQPRSLVVVPMQCGGRRVGYVYAETRSRARGMGESELQALNSAAHEFAWSLEAAYLRCEHLRLRSELERARSDLARSRGLEALGRSTSEIIHELRNLLTVVVGESDLLSGEQLSDAARTSASNIASAARDGCNVISRLQSTVRGLPSNEAEAIDLHEVLTEVLLVSRVRLAGDRLGGGVAVSLAGSAGQMVFGVASELREVFSNLVSNSIDAMPNGGTLSVSIGRTGDSVAVAVADTGHGMTEDVKSRILEPFFTTKGSRGNGLGLAIVQGILTKHGGSIEVESAVGVGTTFTVRLPPARADLGSARWLENTVVGAARQ